MIFEMGANLDGDNYDTSTNDKKNKNVSNKVILKKQHQLVFTFEKRRAKALTLIGRFYLNYEDKKDILKLLKKKLACGGSIKDEWIELQGNVKDKIKTILEAEGWKFK